MTVRTLTADDVVWSMSRHLGEESPSTAKSFFTSVKEWMKVDSHTVKAILNSPDSDLPAKLSEKQAKIVKMGTEDFKKGNGTGPYLLESFEPGVRSTHVPAIPTTGGTDPTSMPWRSPRSPIPSRGSMRSSPVTWTSSTPSMQRAFA